MHRALRFALILLVTVPLVGCTVAEIDAKAPIPLLLNHPKGENFEYVGVVEAKKRYVFHYSGHFDLYEVLRQTNPEQRGDAIVNVHMKAEVTPADFFINLFTIGLAQSRTVRVQGTLVRRKEAALSDQASRAASDADFLFPR